MPGSAWHDDNEDEETEPRALGWSSRGVPERPLGHLRPAGLRGEAEPSFSDVRIFVTIACRRFLLTILTDGPCAGLHAFHVVIGHRGHVMAGMGIGGRGRLALGLRARCRRGGCGSCTWYRRGGSPRRGRGSIACRKSVLPRSHCLTFGGRGCRVCKTTLGCHAGHHRCFAHRRHL